VDQQVELPVVKFSSLCTVYCVTQQPM